MAKERTVLFVIVGITLMVQTYYMVNFPAKAFADRVYFYILLGALVLIIGIDKLIKDIYI